MRVASATAASAAGASPVRAASTRRLHEPSALPRPPPPPLASKRSFLCGCGGPPHATAPIDARGGAVAVWPASGAYISRGSERCAYAGSWRGGPHDGRKCVVKRPLDRARAAEENARAVALAREVRELADAFNATCRPKRPVLVIDAVAARVADVGGGALACGGGGGGQPRPRRGESVVVEDFIAGTFERFVENNGHVAPGYESGTLASFAHFSYHRSHGAKLVVDLQGHRTPDAYVLTDAAMHSVPPNFAPSAGYTGPGRKSVLDHGKNGVLNFFATHVCTAICSGFRTPPFAHSSDLAQRRQKIELDDEDEFPFGSRHR